MKCRHCGSTHMVPFLDLGTAPPSIPTSMRTSATCRNSGIRWSSAAAGNADLVQTEDFAERETFFSSSYAYFSSFSTSWLEHAKRYVADMQARFGLTNFPHRRSRRQ